MYNAYLLKNRTVRKMRKVKGEAKAEWEEYGKDKCRCRTGDNEEGA